MLRLCKIEDKADFNQKVSSVATLSLEGVKVLLGCFLLLFVTQKCDGETCTFSQNANWEAEDNTRGIILGWHFLTALAFLISYKIEWKRDHWLIQTFDSDPSKPDQALQTHWLSRPDLYTQFSKLTKQLIWATRITFAIFIMNTIAASILIIGWHWNGFSTLTSILTQVVLAAQSLLSTNSIAVQSIKRNVPLSTVLQEPTLFNVFDLQLENKKEEELPAETMNTENPVTETTPTSTDEVAVEISDEKNIT